MNRYLHGKLGKDRPGHELYRINGGANIGAHDRKPVVVELYGTGSGRAPERDSSPKISARRNQNHQAMNGTFRLWRHQPATTSGYVLLASQCRASGAHPGTKIVDTTA